MYCKLIKLTNGEDIILSTEDNCETFIGKEFVCGKNIVQVGTMRMPTSKGVVETYVLQPWIRMAKDGNINIPVNSIVVAVDLDERAASQYLDFVEEKTPVSFTKEEEEEINLDSELEDLDFEEEEYDGIPTRNGHTVH